MCVEDYPFGVLDGRHDPGSWIVVWEDQPLITLPKGLGVAIQIRITK